jgi:hypothetical protein
MAIHIYQRSDGGFNIIREDKDGRMVGGVADEETAEQIRGWLNEPLQEVQENSGE